LIAGFALFAAPAETPPVRAAVRGPLVPDSAQCIGATPGDCRPQIAQPGDGNHVLRSQGDGLQMIWMNSSNYPLIPPGAAVSNVTLIVRAMEVNTSANLAVRTTVDGPQIATAIGGEPTVETRELSGPTLVATVRDALQGGKDVTLQLTVSPPTGTTAPALQIDFVALSIEYQAGALTVLPSPSATPTTGGPLVVNPTSTPSGGSGTGATGSPTGVSGTGTGTNTNSSSTSTTGAGGTSTTPMTLATANWLDLPPAVPAARSSCPAGSLWSLLYWNGPNDTAIVSAAPICSTGDRFWVFRNGRWLGYSPLFPTASDTWNTLSGEAHFVRGR
jgi:hypothetical protein